MRRIWITALLLLIAACNSQEAEITTTTIDASLLTTTTTTTTTSIPDDQPPPTGEPVDQVTGYEVISRLSTDTGETLYLLVPPGNYTDVSIENFIGTLLQADPVVSGLEIFDDRGAIDAALKPEEERTDEERALLAAHHLVTVIERRQVLFRGPLSGYDDFVIGS